MCRTLPHQNITDNGGNLERSVCAKEQLTTEGIACPFVISKLWDNVGAAAISAGGIAPEQHGVLDKDCSLGYGYSLGFRSA